MKKLFFALALLLIVSGCIQQQEKKADLTDTDLIKTQLNENRKLLANAINYSFDECFSSQLEKYSGMLPNERKAIASEHCNERFFGEMLGIDSNCLEGTVLKATETGFTTECKKS